MKHMIYTLLVALFLMGLLTGCTEEEPQPDDRFAAYVKSWNDKNFGKMYDLLSNESKGEISKEEFVERYQNIYEGIEANNVNIQFTPPEEDVVPNKSGQVFFPYDVSMDTIAGKITYTHTGILIKEGKEDENWYLSWDPSMIFPKMRDGDLVRVKTTLPRRGELLDRDGKGLAINGEAISIGIEPRRLGENKEEAKGKIATVMEVEKAFIDKQLEQSWVGEETFVPLKTYSKNSEMIEKLMPLDGIVQRKVPAREYPLNIAAAHLTGYIKNITAEQLEELKGKGYTASSQIGQRGLEQVFENELKGEPGAIVFIKHKDKEENTVLASKEPRAGKDIRLTIDASVQKSLYEQLKDDAGTGVAINPQTGEVLGMVSTPGFDPNDFVLGISTSKYEELQNNPNKPMVTRFKQTYAPGSTFKPITAAIGLKNGTLDPNEKMALKGETWKEEGWGNYSVRRVTDPGKPVDLKDALVYSDNIYFAKEALKIGGDTFLKEAKQFGIGEKIPFSYPLNPSQLSNDQVAPEGVLLADTGYGQGEVLMNPVHLAVSYTPFITNGNLLKPVLKMEDSGENVWKKGIISSETASIINKDLIQVVEDPNGTANDARVEGMQLAGKTGTAELKQKNTEDGKENGLAVAYDAQQKDFLVLLLVENANKGSHDVLPKVKTIFENRGKE
ncbi:penicillin-binding transpeptidase domain-containing protein [Pseudalkalibacillus caeni]|nr:penicillin-binding transpeptidase domain-containing protein [Pseudalkalibacillus caeni]